MRLGGAQCYVEKWVNNMLNPWERQESDTTASFEAFAIYRDLGPTRSLTKVAQTLHKSKTIIGRWSGQHNWVARAEAYDQYLDQIRLEEEEEARKLMNKEHAAIAKLMLQKVLKRLEMLDPEELSTHDVQKWVEVGTKTERQARGESTENLQQEGKVVVRIIDNMDELED